MALTLNKIPKSSPVEVVDVTSGHAISERLVELGFTAGECIEVIHEAPISRDPIVVACAGTRIALRRSEAQLIIVKLFEKQKGEKL